MSASTQTLSAENSSVSRRFARFALTLEAGAVPPPVFSHATLCILDAIGTALAARTYDFSAPVLAACHSLGQSGVSPSDLGQSGADQAGSAGGDRAVVIGQAARLPLRDAALANGTLIHSLDFDDTHGASVVHCTASAWPAAFNVAGSRGASGSETLLAYLLAVEADARIGAVARGGLQRRGFHPTGLIGAFGAALAAARLMQLEEAAIANALGIVLSMASGSMAFLADGAWTKRLHPGWAAVSGITAAHFAAAGFVGPAAPVEGPLGLFDALLGADYAAAAADLGHDLGQIWRTQENAVKPYPACHFNHAYADCVLALRDAHAIPAAEIERITALVHPDEAAVVCQPRAQKIAPSSAYEAQFSVPYIVAATWLRGRFTLAELDQATLTDPEIRALAARVVHSDDPDSRYPQYYSGGLIVHTRDGTVYRHHQPVHRGADANPLDADDIVSKFFDNATRLLSESQARRIADAVLALPQAESLDELDAALGCDPATATAA